MKNVAGRQRTVSLTGGRAALGQTLGTGAIAPSGPLMR